MTPREYIPKESQHIANGNHVYGGFVFSLNAEGGWASDGFKDEDIAYQHYAKPVISLKSDALKYGTGTSTDPFRITEEI